MFNTNVYSKYYIYDEIKDNEIIWNLNQYHCNKYPFQYQKWHHTLYI